MQAIREKYTNLNIEQPVIKFATGNTLIIDKESGELKLMSREDVLQLTIHIKGDGLTLDINATQLNITAAEELNLSSKKINIDGSELVKIKSGGNLVTEVKKDSLTEVAGSNKNIAQVHKIAATLGNVDIKANDHIRLNGESVLLNCD